VVEVITQSVGGSLLGQYLPENVVRIPVAAGSECSNVGAYLMLEFVQALESSDLLLY
jgi:hypothetical protein